MHGHGEWKLMASYVTILKNKIKIKKHKINITINHYNYHYKRVIITEEDCSPVALVSLSRLGLVLLTYSILVTSALNY